VIFLPDQDQSKATVAIDPVVVRHVEVASRSVLRLENLIKSLIHWTACPTFGDFSSQARLWIQPSRLLAFWPCMTSSQFALTVAESHWPTVTTDLEDQPTESSEEPPWFLATFSG
jgi:hypothetical protein